MAALYQFMKAVFEPENMMDLHLVYSDIEHLMVLFFPGDMHMMGLVWVNYPGLVWAFAGCLTII